MLPPDGKLSLRRVLLCRQVLKDLNAKAARVWPISGTAHRRTPALELATARCHPSSRLVLTPYAFLQIFPQDEHERLLIARLEAMGVSVERQTELLGYDDDGERIVARLRAADGRQQECAVAYIAGCDGARSVVRQTMGVDFPTPRGSNPMKS